MTTFNREKKTKKGNILCVKKCDDTFYRKTSKTWKQNGKKMYKIEMKEK